MEARERRVPPETREKRVTKVTKARRAGPARLESMDKRVLTVATELTVLEEREETRVPPETLVLMSSAPAWLENTALLTLPPPPPPPLTLLPPPPLIDALRSFKAPNYELNLFSTLRCNCSVK